MGKWMLFFVVPGRRTFAVLGDAGIHEKVGQQFWDRLSAAMTSRFKEGDFTGGLVDAIDAVAAELAKHFPWREGDENELANQVAIADRPHGASRSIGCSNWECSISAR